MILYLFSGKDQLTNLSDGILFLCKIISVLSYNVNDSKLDFTGRDQANWAWGIS